MARRTVLYVDGTKRKLLDSPFSKQNGTMPDFVTGEKVTIDVVPLKEIEDGSNPAYEPDTSYDSDTWKMGLGLVDDFPTEGTFKLTYGANTTTALDWDATASEVGDALNALASVTSAGGVTVDGDNEKGYRVTWVTAGAKTDFSGAEVNLLPDSTIAVSTEREGDTNIMEVVQIRLVQKQAGLTTTKSAIPTPSMSISQKVAGSVITKEKTNITCIANTAAVAQREDITCVAVGGVKHIATITTDGLTVNGKYFVLYDDEGSVGFWIDEGDTGTAIPAGADALDRQVEITTLTSGDSDGEQANLVAAAINADSKFSATHDGNVVTVTYSTIGNHGAAADGAQATGWAFANPTTGASTDAYDGKYFYLSSLDSNGVESINGFYFSQDGTTDPPAAALLLDTNLTEITYNDDATAQEMAGVVATAIGGLTPFTATASGTEVHVVHATAGDVTDGAVGDSPMTFAITEQGADITLDGKHFILYESDGEGGEQSRAFWFNGSGNASPTGTALTADTTTEITTLTGGEVAYEVASTLAGIIDALSGYSAVAKGTKVLVTAAVGYNHTLATAETSGFTFALAQDGGTGSAASEVDEIQFSDQAIGGVFTLGINLGNGVVNTGGIPWNVSPTEMEEILAKISGITLDDVYVEGGFGGDIRISFQNNLAATAITVTVDDSAIVWIQGYRFTLDLSTTTAYSLIYGQDSVDVVFELEATQGSTYTVKLLRENCTLLNGLIDPSALAPAPIIDYYTGTEIDNLIIHHLKSTTSLTGGTSSDLDSIATTGITVDRGIFMWDADNSRYAIYVLKSGTDAESAPDVIRPDDYATTTNEKVWVWVPFGESDHGALTGLGDDDHTQYLRVDGTRAGTGIQEFLGLNLTDKTIKAISTGAVTVTQGFHALAAETGTADTLDTITAAKGHGDVVYLMADTGDTITIDHGGGNIQLWGGTDMTLSGNQCIQFIYDGSWWVEVGNVEDTGTTGNYYTSSATITGLTGGTAADLDSITTTTLTVGDLQTVVAKAVGSTQELELVYRLDSGTDAEDAPWVVRPDDYAASTNERVWRLIAPWTTTTLEVFGVAEEHSTGDHYFCYTNDYWKIHDVQLDLAALPSGTGSGVVEWNVKANAVRIFGTDITQAARCWRAIADEAVSFTAGEDTIAPKIELELVIDDIGGLTPGTGAVIHIRHLYSPINS